MSEREDRRLRIEKLRKIIKRLDAAEDHLYREATDCLKCDTTARLISDLRKLFASAQRILEEHSETQTGLR